MGDDAERNALPGMCKAQGTGLELTLLEQGQEHLAFPMQCC